MDTRNPVNSHLPGKEVLIMNTRMKKIRLTVLLVIGLTSLQAYADHWGGKNISLTTAGVAGLLFPRSALAASYQNLVYAAQELENRSGQFIERFDRLYSYRKYGFNQRDSFRRFRHRLLRFDELVQQLAERTAYREQTFRLLHLFDRIKLQADNIEYDLPRLPGYRQLRRSWRKVKYSLRRVENILAVSGNSGSITPLPGPVPESDPLPWQQPPRKPIPTPRPRSGHYPTWQEIRADNDIIEDYSERAKNAFRTQMNTDANLRRQSWARKTRDQLSLFDQTANQLRRIVYTRPQNPGAAVAATVRKMQSQRRVLDKLMRGQNVNGQTRNYWSVIGSKLDHLSCLLVLDGCQ